MPAPRWADRWMIGGPILDAPRLTRSLGLYAQGIVQDRGSARGSAWASPWGHDHVFWVFNGYDGVIDRVDFHGWHPDAAGGLGGEDHTDGEYFRYSVAAVGRGRR